MNWLFRAVMFACVCLVLSPGCSKKRPDAKRVRVSGKVTLDSRALTTGTITFDPGTGEAPAVLEILDGNYEGKAPVGKNKVQISAVRKTSMREKMGFDGPGYNDPIDENILPDRYHAKSQITREVEAGEDNRFNFELLSK